MLAKIRIAIAFALLAAASAGHAFTLGRIVDSFQHMPGTPNGVTFHFDRGLALAAIRNGKIVFYADASDGSVAAVWRVDVAGSAYTRLADTTMTFPGGSGPFYGVAPFRFDGANVVFRGSDQDNYGSQAGYYLVPFAGGAPTLLVNQDSTRPDFGDHFGWQGIGKSFTLDAAHLVFDANRLYAIALPDGVVQAYVGDIAICDEGEYLDSFAGESISGDRVAFYAWNVFGSHAIFVAPRSGLTGESDSCTAPLLRADNITRIADRHTAIPAGGGATFDPTQFNAPVIDGDTVVFRGGDGNGLFGIYAASIANGTLIRLVDTNTPVPGGSGNFRGPPNGFSLDRYTVKGGVVVFLGIEDDTGLMGIYAMPAGGGAIRAVVHPNDTLPDGRVVFGASGLDFANKVFQADSLDDAGRLALTLEFTDPTLGFGEGVYTAFVGDVIFRDGFD